MVPYRKNKREAHSNFKHRLNCCRQDIVAESTVGVVVVVVLLAVVVVRDPIVSQWEILA